MLGHTVFTGKICLTCKLGLEEHVKFQGQILTTPEQITLITDIFLAAVAAVIATLIILSTKGISLGELNGIGTLGTQTAYIMLGVAGGVVLLDIGKLLGQMILRIKSASGAVAYVMDEKGRRETNFQTASQQQKEDEELADSLALCK